MSQEELDRDEGHITLRLRIGRAHLHQIDRRAFGAGTRDGDSLVGADGSRLIYRNGMVFFEKANIICPPDDEEPDPPPEGLKTKDLREKGSGV
jgi:hypothetical protein